MSSYNQNSSRRRGANLEKALLDAAWDELNEMGYEAFSIDSVAKRAGTSKTVIYRRWANRLELVHATIRTHKPLVTGRVPNTGSLRDDVITILEQMADGLDSARLAVSVSMLADILGDTRQRDYMSNAIHGSNVDAMREVIGHAKKRNEITSEDLSDRVLTLPLDLVRNELVITGKPPTKSAILEIVDDVFLPLI